MTLFIVSVQSSSASSLLNVESGRTPGILCNLTKTLNLEGMHSSFHVSELITEMVVSFCF